MARGAVRLPPQPSDSLTADMVVEAVNWALREFGVHSRADRMAQEFGDHSDEALPAPGWRKPRYRRLPTLSGPAWRLASEA